MGKRFEETSPKISRWEQAHETGSTSLAIQFSSVQSLSPVRLFATL